MKLGKTTQQRHIAYRELFKQVLDDETVNKIRESTNKAWVLGNDRFKEEIARMVERRISPLAKGGDRKSKQFNETRINGV